MDENRHFYRLHKKSHQALIKPAEQARTRLAEPPETARTRTALDIARMELSALVRERSARDRLGEVLRDPARGLRFIRDHARRLKQIR